MSRNPGIYDSYKLWSKHVVVSAKPRVLDVQNVENR